MKPEGNWLSELHQFAPAQHVPQNEEILRKVLNSPIIKHITSHALGPLGTNIIKAAASFHRRIGIVGKAEVVPCDTPEEALYKVRATAEADELALFWTCAVYVKENALFFESPDTFPFAFQELMPLDKMQLACASGSAQRILAEINRESLRIAAHPSPLPLVKGLPFQVVPARSNAHAADLVVEGKADVCITTEDARKARRLATLWEFGSPTMIFFGGVSQSGMALLQRAFADLGVGASSLPTAA